jgi:hypothetical protein
MKLRWHIIARVKQSESFESRPCVPDGAVLMSLYGSDVWAMLQGQNDAGEWVDLADYEWSDRYRNES